LKLDQIYNVDESGLYWKGLPTRTLEFQKEKCAPNHKSSKAHLTVICCGNACGNHKMKPVVIGKARKPQLQKGTEENCFSIHYYTQKGAWIVGRYSKTGSVRSLFQKFRLS
jgi:hypothetical protein